MCPFSCDQIFNIEYSISHYHYLEAPACLSVQISELYFGQTPPDQSLETNAKAPEGEIPTKSLKVLCDL